MGASVDAKINFGPPHTGGGSANVSIDPDTILDNLDFAFMINGEARKGRWLVATDVIYLNFGNTDSTVQSVDLNPGPGRINVSTAGLNTGTQTDLEGWVWTLVGGYAAIQEPRASLDVLGGFRYLNLDAKTSWQLNTTVTGTGPGGATATFARRVAPRSPRTSGPPSSARRGGRSSAQASGSSITTPTSGAGRRSSPGRGRSALGTPSNGATSSSTTGISITARAGDKLIDNMSFGGFALGANFRF